MLGAKSSHEFTLDPFQQRAITAFDLGESVLVAAPTGAGKTVVAEHAIEQMLSAGLRTFYTSPIKALANQKFRDFCERFGPQNVGLLTGDLTVRGEAAVVVMTTEVLRNMLYESAARVYDLGCVVLDEVHYLQDRQRGPVWEEVLLNLPLDVRTVSLSATVSNLAEFVAWLRTVRGPTALIEERDRPVPLRHQLAVADRDAGTIEVVPLLARGRLTDRAKRYAAQKRTDRSRGHRRGARPQRARSRWAAPRRTSLADDLVLAGLSPLIWFVFSRAGCDEAVEQCVRAGLRYTTAEEADELAAILDEATSEIDDDDWYSLGLDEWQRAFEAGIASHHAGLIPALKEAVETAFDAGLIRMVFATETLALGVNLPARSVVLERLIKFNGETHEQLTPLEYTQLTGRAGRRGLDAEGTAVCCWSARVPVEDMARLAASTDFPLRSAFAPNYNMVANLIGHADEIAARRFVTRSFAQYQRDRTVVDFESRLVRIEEQIAEAERSAACERGDVREWRRSNATKRSAGDDELGDLRPGDIIAGLAGPGVMVLSVAHRGGGVVVRAMSAGGRVTTHRRGDLASPILILEHVDLPQDFAPADSTSHRWAAAELESRGVEQLPGVSGCPDIESHLKALADIERLGQRARAESGRSDRTQGALVREFDAVAAILHERGFASRWELTAKGHVLAAVHGEAEAVLAEALDTRILEDLEPAALAAVLSTLVYEHRGADSAPAFRWPDRRVRSTYGALKRIAEELRILEAARFGRFLTREPDPGLVATVYGWAVGESLESVLDDDVAGGDFVRSMRQVVDLCRQVAGVAGADLGETASEAAHRIDRGVVRSARDIAVGLSTPEIRQ